MADFLPHNGPSRCGLPTPLTLTALQTLVGGFIAFVDLESGDVLVVNEFYRDGLAPYNKFASSLAGYDVFGDAVFCTPSEIA